MTSLLTLWLLTGSSTSLPIPEAKAAPEPIIYSMLGLGATAATSGIAAGTGTAALPAAVTGFSLPVIGGSLAAGVSGTGILAGVGLVGLAGLAGYIGYDYARFYAYEYGYFDDSIEDENILGEYPLNFPDGDIDDEDYPSHFHGLSQYPGTGDLETHYELGHSSESPQSLYVKKEKPYRTKFISAPPRGRYPHDGNDEYSSGFYLTATKFEDARPKPGSYKTIKPNPTILKQGIEVYHIKEDGSAPVLLSKHPASSQYSYDTTEHKIVDTKHIKEEKPVEDSDFATEYKIGHEVKIGHDRKRSPPTSSDEDYKYIYVNLADIAKDDNQQITPEYNEVEEEYEYEEEIEDDINEEIEEKLLDVAPEEIDRLLELLNYSPQD